MRSLTEVHVHLHLHLHTAHDRLLNCTKSMMCSPQPPTAPFVSRTPHTHSTYPSHSPGPHTRPSHPSHTPTPQTHTYTRTPAPNTRTPSPAPFQFSRIGPAFVEAACQAGPTPPPPRTSVLYLGRAPGRHRSIVNERELLTAMEAVLAPSGLRPEVWCYQCERGNPAHQSSGVSKRFDHTVPGAAMPLVPISPLSGCL